MGTETIEDSTKAPIILAFFNDPLNFDGYNETIKSHQSGTLWHPNWQATILALRNKGNQ